MNDCKLVAIDLDGTLTDSEKNIPKQNFDALMRIQRKGVKIVLASGRPKYGIQKLSDELQMPEYNGFVLAYNGATVIDCSSNTIISSISLPRQVLPSLCETAKELNVAILTYDAPNDLILTEIRDNKWIEYVAWLNNRMKIKYVENLNEAAPNELPKCLMVGEPNRMAEVEPIIRQKYPQIDAYRSSSYILEIVPKGIDKAKILSSLVDNLGLNSNQVVAFGDGYNDIEMIRYAGLGIAMANGCDEIKQIADYITLSNDENGVAYAIDKLNL